MDNNTNIKGHSLIHVEPIDSKILSISDLLISKFDYTIKNNMYKEVDNTFEIYDYLRKIMARKKEKSKMKLPIITLSSDSSISGSTITGTCEKYMNAVPNGNNIIYKSDIKVIYIDALPDLSQKKYSHYVDFESSILSDSCGLTNNSSFSKARIFVDPKNVYCIGLNDIILPNDQELLLKNNDFNYFTLDIMRKKGINKIMDYVIEECKYDNVHVVIDLSVMSKKFAPSVNRLNLDEANDGFDHDEIIMILNKIKKLKLLNSVDITGYNFGYKEHKEKHMNANSLTILTIELILKNLINIKEKRINLFDENSKFLIYKKMNDIEPIGWKILRGLTIDQREEFIKAINNRIEIVPVNDKEINDFYDAFVTTTCIKEQQEKSYYVAKDMFECCLYPGEKLSMMFELINSPSLKLNSESQKLDCSAKIKINNLL